MRKIAGEGKMIWTPGVNINVGDGELGQRYGSPEEAVNSGSDCIIVGSGIHKAAEPKASARAYADASWNALLNR